MILKSGSHKTRVVQQAVAFIEAHSEALFVPALKVRHYLISSNSSCKTDVASGNIASTYRINLVIDMVAITLKWLNLFEGFWH